MGSHFLTTGFLGQVRVFVLSILASYLSGPGFKSWSAELVF